MKNSITTSHNLDFEACPWPRSPEIMLFRIGTCEGQWMSTETAFCIISIINNKPGNGHLTDVFEWFEFACKRDKKALMILEFMNDRFKTHCVDKRGFTPIPGTDNAIKLP